MRIALEFRPPSPGRGPARAAGPAFSRTLREARPPEPFEGLRLGDRGASVARVQKVLARWNRQLRVEITGVYDARTRRALTLYQAIYGPGGDGSAIDAETARHLRRMEDGTFWLDPPPKTPAQKILYHASRCLGIPYRLGGDGVHATDCGKLTARALREAGVHPQASRLADMQYRDAERGNGGLRLTRGEPRPGDLVFFRIPTRQSSLAYRGITHVALYVGGGLILAASSGAGRVVLQQLSPLAPYLAGYGRPAG